MYFYGAPPNKSQYQTLISRESKCLRGTPSNKFQYQALESKYLRGAPSNKSQYQALESKYLRGAPPNNEKEEEEEEEDDDDDEILLWQERERMDDTVLGALRRGNKTFVEELFSTEDSVIIDFPNADNVAEQAERKNWRGVTAGRNSALHIVATFGHLELAKLICARDSSLLAARNAALETPLHCAARAGADQIVSHFISEAGQGKEAVLRVTDRKGKTALHAAAEEGRVAVAGVLMSEDPELVGIVDNNGVSPLYAAVLSKSLEVVQKLIGSRAEGGGGVEPPAEGGGEGRGVEPPTEGGGAVEPHAEGGGGVEPPAEGGGGGGGAEPPAEGGGGGGVEPPAEGGGAVEPPAERGEGGGGVEPPAEGGGVEPPAEGRGVEQEVEPLAASQTAGTPAGSVTREISYAGPNGQTALHAAAIAQSPGS